MEVAMIDCLEPRRLMSAHPFSAVISKEAMQFTVIDVPRTPHLPTVINGVIHVDGTSKDDSFRVQRVEHRTSNAGTVLTRQFTADGRMMPEGVVGNFIGIWKYQKPRPIGDPGLVTITSGNFIHIVSGRNEFYMHAEGIIGVEINTGAGDDKVSIATNLKLSSTIIGGSGNDTLLGGIRADDISGGDGDDYIVGGRVDSSTNRIAGGNGEDMIFASSVDDDLVHASDGVVDHVTILIDADKTMEYRGVISGATGSEDQFFVKPVKLRKNLAADIVG